LVPKPIVSSSTTSSSESSAPISPFVKTITFP
jgi:hypothetical protein